MVTVNTPGMVTINTPLFPTILAACIPHFSHFTQTIAGQLRPDSEWTMDLIGAITIRTRQVGWVLLYVHRNRRLIRDGSPGRPPRLSHSSWALTRQVSTDWYIYPTRHEWDGWMAVFTSFQLGHTLPCCVRRFTRLSATRTWTVNVVVDCLCSIGPCRRHIDWESRRHAFRLFCDRCLTQPSRSVAQHRLFLWLQGPPKHTHARRNRCRCIMHGPSAATGSLAQSQKYPCGHWELEISEVEVQSAHIHPPAPTPSHCWYTQRETHTHAHTSVRQFRQLLPAVR